MSISFWVDGDVGCDLQAAYK